MNASSTKNLTTFWHVWIQHQNYFYSCCLRWLNGNDSDAEDLLSQAMLKAWNKWPDDAEKIVNPRAWIARIIHNLCVDFHRQRKRIDQNIEILEKLKSIQGSEDFEFSEERLFYQDLRGYLSQAIETLPIKLRETFILRHYQDKSYKEIARKFSVSEDAVYKRVQHAIALLRQQLDPYYFSDRENEKMSPIQSSVKPDRQTKEAFKLKVTETFAWQQPITTKNCEESISYNTGTLCLPILSRVW